MLDGAEVVSFSSNDYLGFAAHPALRAAMVAAVESAGVGAGASRLIIGNSTLHEELERCLATLHGQPAARLFNSGFAANTGLIPVLAGPDDVVFSDALNHASIIDGCRLSRATVRVFEHRNYNELNELVCVAKGARRRLIVSESLFSMDGDLADLVQLREISSEHDAVLVVDDAHGTGVYGESGCGLASRAGADIVVGTLGKALGCHGAWVSGPVALAELLWTRARSLVFSTGLPPSVAAAGIAATRLVSGPDGDRARALLWEAVDALVGGLTALGLAAGRSPIVPLLVGGDREVMEWTRWLLERGLFVQGIRPPTVPEGTARLRIALSASHSAEDVGRLLDAIATGLAAGLTVCST